MADITIGQSGPFVGGETVMNRMKHVVMNDDNNDDESKNERRKIING